MVGYPNITAEVVANWLKMYALQEKLQSSDLNFYKKLKSGVLYQQESLQS